MTHRPFRPLLCASAALCIAIACRPSIAELTRDQCVDANARGQDLRREGKLAAARVELTHCAVRSCPALVRDDCTRRLDEIARAQPSIVFEVKDGTGADLIDVRVLVDGQPLTDRLDGRALDVDPGPHDFTFQAAGRTRLTMRYLIREGETVRRERVVIVSGTDPGLASPTATLATAPTFTSISTKPQSPQPSPTGLGTTNTIALVLAGAGVASIGVGAVFGLMARSAWDDAKRACGGDPLRCVDVANGSAHRDTTDTDGTVSTVAFSAGAALLAAGAIVYFTNTHHRDSAGAAMTIAPSLGPSQAGIALRGVLP